MLQTSNVKRQTWNGLSAVCLYLPALLTERESGTLLITNWLLSLIACNLYIMKFTIWLFIGISQFIIHLKYFAASYWFQSPSQFFITDWRLPYLEDGSNIPSIGDSMVCLIRNEFDPWLYAWKRGYLGNRHRLTSFPGTAANLFLRE